MQPRDWSIPPAPGQGRPPAPRSNFAAYYLYVLIHYWPLCAAYLATFLTAIFFDPPLLGLFIGHGLIMTVWPLRSKARAYMPTLYPEQNELTARANQLARTLDVKPVTVHINEDSDGYSLPFITRRGCRILISVEMVRLFTPEMLDYAIARQLLDDERGHWFVTVFGGACYYALMYGLIFHFKTTMWIFIAVVVIAVTLFALLSPRVVFRKDLRALSVTKHLEAGLETLKWLCFSQSYISGQKITGWHRVYELEQAAHLGPGFQVH